MKKTGILNKDISEVIASMGHMDTIVVCDAGLPIPQSVRRIDLAISAGLPGFIETTQAIANDLKVESIFLAEEIKKVSPKMLSAILEIFPDVKVKFISHDQLKEMSQSARAIVRTGEFTPYANVILVSGVVF